MAGSTWVFGYGSLVSPASIALTLGRHPDPLDGMPVASLIGFGRRWNYGSMHQRGDWRGSNGWVENGVVVCLGLVADDGERCNGVVVRVTDDELARLDWRERDYDRVDVTDRVTVERDDVDGRIVTYVPRRSAIERYEEASAAGRAAIEERYHLLVEEAFSVLGDTHLSEYRRTTPAPDVPVVVMRRRP